jgi:hypothetical protein
MKIINHNKTIAIIFIIATCASIYFWYKAEYWSIIVQSSEGWYEYQEESYRSINFVYLVAFYRIILIWIITGFWSVFLGLRSKIKS